MAQGEKMRIDTIVESKFIGKEPVVTKQVTGLGAAFPVQWQNGQRVPLIGPEEVLVIAPPAGV